MASPFDHMTLYWRGARVGSLTDTNASTPQVQARMVGVDPELLQRFEKIAWLLGYWLEEEFDDSLPDDEADRVYEAKRDELGLDEADVDAWDDELVAEDATGAHHTLDLAWAEGEWLTWRWGDPIEHGD